MKIDELKTGDIVLFSTSLKLLKPDTWVSYAIRKVAKVKYNHVGVVIVNWGEACVNEAVKNGIVASPAKERLSAFDGQVRIMRPRFSNDVHAGFADEANSQVGLKKYDYLGCFWNQLIYQLTSHKLWVGEGKNRADNKFYCYEYVAWLYRSTFADWWKIDPDTIINSNQFTVVFEGDFKNQ